MKLNIKTVLAREQERKNEVKPLPKIRISAAPPSEPKVPPQLTLPPSALPPPPSSPAIPLPDSKQSLLSDLRTQFTEVKKARAKLSTRTAYLVQEVYERLLKEGSTIATAFMAGELSIPELKQHYAEIQSLSDTALKLYDDIHYVELNGKLPTPSTPALNFTYQDDDVKAVQYEIRRLDDLIYKTGKKLETGKPKNTDRVNIWRQKIALAEAKRDDLKLKLKRMQYGARTERTGE